MSGDIRCIIRLRDVPAVSPLPSPRRAPALDRSQSNPIIYVPSGKIFAMIMKLVARLFYGFAAGSGAQVVLQPTSMNLPAKKYDFSAAFGTDATHEAVFAQVVD